MTSNLDATGKRDRLARLASLYKEIHEWASEADPDLVARVPVARSIRSEVMVIGRALAIGTQRLSGYPYTLPGGALSAGGQKLDEFLRRFGYTIDTTGLANRKPAVHAVEQIADLGLLPDERSLKIGESELA